MNSISVLYMSHVTLLQGMELRSHVHDYWHFSLALEGALATRTGQMIRASHCSCYPPHIPHAGGVVCKEEHTAINVMFLVHDKLLCKRLEQFPFRQIRKEHLHIPLLMSIMEQAHTLCPGQDLIDFAFGYYLHLLMESAQDSIDVASEVPSLSEKAVNFIHENCCSPIKLEDLAEYIDRNRTYTAHLLSRTTGMTFMEHLVGARMKHACALLAYSDLPLDRLSKACGFNSTSNFCRVFKLSTGMTPNKYRTSHKTGDLFYPGDAEDLTAPYERPVYTYIPGARKCVDWKTPREYLNQAPDNL